MAGEETGADIVHAHFDDDMAVVVAEIDALDRAEGDGLVLHLRLPGGQPFGGVEGQRQQRALLEERAVAEIAGDDGARSAGSARPRRSAGGARWRVAAGRHAAGVRQARRASRSCGALPTRCFGGGSAGASHISLGSKALTANMVSTTTAAKQDAPGSRADIGELAETHQGDQDRDHEDVDHRPAADELDDAEGPRAADEMLIAAVLRCQQHVAQGQKFHAAEW